MKKEEILSKIQNDIDYIPTIEGLKLIGKDFLVGETPVFKIILENEMDKKLVRDIESQTRDARPEGLYELYQQLEMLGSCSSYSDARIFYVAYTLAKENIKINIEGFEYRRKLEKKVKIINELLNAFEY